MFYGLSVARSGYRGRIIKIQLQITALGWLSFNSPTFHRFNEQGCGKIHANWSVVETPNEGFWIALTQSEKS